MPQYLLCYDITCPRRWRRLHRGFKALALPVQYSVFLADLTPAGLASVVALIETTICPKTDDVRIYPLQHEGWQRRLGRTLLPQGISLTGLPLGFRTMDAGPPDALRPADAAAPPATTARHASRATRAHQARAQTGQRRGITLL